MRHIHKPYALTHFIMSLCLLFTVTLCIQYSIDWLDSYISKGIDFHSLR